MMAMTTTLATLPSPIMPNTTAVHTVVESSMMFVMPQRSARKPLVNRPMTLHPFRITSYANVVRYVL